MKALVKTKKGTGNIEIQQKPIPNISDDEVLIKIKVAGICGTDIHIYHDNFPYWPPVILGHEFSGEVVKAGKNIKKIRAGDRVIGEPHTKACGTCYLCRTGNIQICAEKRSPGWGIDGAFAEYLKMPENLLHKIPENVSFDEAALLEPCAIIAHEVLERGGITPADNVVVFGAGAIGILAAQMATIAGAGKVIMVGLSSDEEYRFKVAEEIGCVTRLINVDKEDTLSVVMDLTKGIGADVVIEASGAAPAICSAIEVLRKKGKLIAIGLTGKNVVSVPWDSAMKKVLDVFFNMSSSYKGWDIAIKLLEQSKLKLRPLISMESIENWEKAFEDIQAGKALKVLLKI